MSKPGKDVAMRQVWRGRKLCRGSLCEAEKDNAASERAEEAGERIGDGDEVDEGITVLPAVKAEGGDEHGEGGAHRAGEAGTEEFESFAGLSCHVPVTASDESICDST